MATLTKDDLRQFGGSEEMFRHFTGMIYTEGVRYLAESAGAYWLIDLIASYQKKLRRNSRLAEIQFWELKVDAEKSTAVVTCCEDSDVPPAVRQEIEFTDFHTQCGLTEVKIYVGDGQTILLPSEY